jgi:hypothetical protein
MLYWGRFPVETFGLQSPTKAAYVLISAIQFPFDPTYEHEGLCSSHFPLLRNHQ